MESLREAFQRLTQALNMGVMSAQEVSEAMVSMGYEVSDDALQGPALDVTMPLSFQAGERIRRGDLLALTPEGEARRAREWEIPAGVSLEEVRANQPQIRVRIAGRLGAGDILHARERVERQGYASGVEMFVHPSMAWAMNASVAYIGGNEVRRVDGGRVQNRYQYSRFPEEVEAKAWKLLEEYMTSDQYFAFMENVNIELENQEKTYRLLVNKKGDFTILQGASGAGIVATSGKIYSYKYPLGDEIAAFLDWFKYKTEELITNWNCGTYGIVKENERR